MSKNYLFTIFLGLAFHSLAQAQANSPYANVDITEYLQLCTPGACTQLQAVFPEGRDTNTYGVTTIPYQNLYPYTGGTVLNAACDDVWTPAFTLPFNFCFYGNTYNQLLVGSNGVITFDLLTAWGASCNGQLYCPWNFSGTIPSNTFPIKNAIYGVYQDSDIRTASDGGGVTDPVTQNVNYYVGGIAPNRYFVVNFNELPLYMCGASAGLQTSQVVLHETTNIIDVFVHKRTSCTTWTNSRGVIGVQNQAGTLASFPQDRNTGTWSATNEAYRFTPNGPTATSSVSWSKNGVAYSANNNIIDVCPEEGDIFTVDVTYTRCDGTTAMVNASTTMHITPQAMGNPNDLSACSSEPTAVFDLTDNAIVATEGNNPENYEIAYFHTLQDAENFTGDFATPQNYVGTNGEIIYMRIEDLTTGLSCHAIKTFQLNVNPVPGPPTGDPEQNFDFSATLADIVVEGNNITWYDQPTGGNVLPPSTLVVSETTYYASQANDNGCENTDRNALTSDRLAVTVTLTLGTGGWNKPVFEIRPNPVTDVLTVSGSQNIKAVSVYNLLGQKIMETTVNAATAQIDLSDLATGTYLVKIHADGFVKTSKIVKQ